MEIFDCTTCTRPDCYRRLPKEVGGLGLCPGYIPAAPEPVVDVGAVEAKITEMQEWDRIAQEAKEAADAIRDELKATMLKMDNSEWTVGRFIVRWTEVLSNRFDTTGFKKVMPDVYKAYTKQVKSRRFTVSE